MQRSGKIPSSIVGPILTSAAVLDMVLVLFVSAMVTDQLSSQMSRTLPSLPSELHGAGLFVIFLLVYWILTELVLGGRTLGRLAHGLTMCDDKGRPLSAGRRINRFSRKMATCGLAGINPLTAPPYDTKTGVVWFATMVPPLPRALPRWQLKVKTGRLQGKEQSLGRFPSFRDHGLICIGRDKAWAHLVLPDASISARHAILQVHEGKLMVRDGDGSGKGSSNGTFLNGKHLKAGQAAWINDARTLRLGDVAIEIIR